MRRTDREIKDRTEIDGIIRRCRVCHLALCDEGQPYVIPLSFGYDGHRLFFHGAEDGRKIAMLRKNNRVCFEFDVPGDVIPGAQACGWSMNYESVIGFGQARILEDHNEKRHALNCIMRQCSNQDWDFPHHEVSRTLVFEVDIGEISGKRRESEKAAS